MTQQWRVKQWRVMHELCHHQIRYKRLSRTLSLSAGYARMPLSVGLLAQCPNAAIAVGVKY